MNKKTMSDYIVETSSVMKQNIENYKQLTQPLVRIVQRKECKRIWLIASGSSYNACHCARPFMMKYLGIDVKIVSPFTFTYCEHALQSDDFAFVVTQSGLSTNAIEALKKVEALGHDAICLTGNVSSDVSKYAKYLIDYGVGEELVGYVTKGVTTLCLFLMLFAIAYKREDSVLFELEKAVSLHEEMKEKASLFIKENYKHFSAMQQLYCCGVGSSYGTALECALKVGETIHVPTSCYEVEEYIHGPNLQLTPAYSVILFDDNEHTSDRIVQIYKASRMVSDHVFLITCKQVFQDDPHVLSYGQIDSMCAPLVALVFAQVLSANISGDLKTVGQHPLLRKFKNVVSAKTESFVNYDEDEN